MDEGLGEEIGRIIGSVQSLRHLVPEGGLRKQEKVAEEMDDLISPEYEPYFLGNAALHICASCQRCGRCCREEREIAVSGSDCRRIAKHLNISLKAFMRDYTRPHSLSSRDVGDARMMRKNVGEPCPFFDPSLPGCRIHAFKPQVCSAAFYLSKMNLLICEEMVQFSSFPNCPADLDLRAKMADLASRLKNDPLASGELERFFYSDLPEAELFRKLLRLKGIEIYFGQEMAALLAGKLGLKRLPGNSELHDAAFLYAVLLTGRTSEQK
ncbi:Putative zinc- or iron-chelating domain protein [uncultured archaeon]|nr:Putative zinc- or iron-chelating domain protein [uncultured archaeon]